MKIAYLPFVFLLFVSVTAEIWSNSKPLLVVSQHGLSLPIFGEDVDFRSTVQFVIWPLGAWDAFESDESLEKYPSPPSLVHWMGVDDRGRDVFARWLYGMRVSLAFALAAWAGAFIIGVVLGLVQGYWGGWPDLLLQRMSELVVGLPALVVTLVWVALFGGSFYLLFGISVFFGWVNISYLVRSEVLRLKAMPFVMMSKGLGSSTFSTLIRHILPNCLVPVWTFSPLVIAGYIYTLTTLDYLGLGLEPPTPSWGELLKQGQRHFESAWWLLLFPSLGLFFLTLNLHQFSRKWLAK